MKRVGVMGLLLALACSAKSDGPASTPGAREAKAPAEEPPRTLTEEEERAHTVVFADRTSYAYLLLLPEGKAPAPPTRDELVALVRKQLADHLQEEEVGLLIKLIETDPDTMRHPGNVDPSRIGQSDQELKAFDEIQKTDLLGLYIDVLEIGAEPENPLIPPRSFADPVLTRELSPEERTSLPGRTHALLLRAEYRNQHGVRGLRLLQTLTGIAAERYAALIHDWDVGETLNGPAFERRRLKSGEGNVADQIAVVPFEDPKGGVRLSTRGMRRFGAPELELDGLPADMALLQQATHFLYGAAFLVTVASQTHSSGIAVQADDVLQVTYRDVERAYAGRGAAVPRCSECEEQAELHLVIRPQEPTDPRGHPVARIVAPREQSDARAYDHAAWVKQAIGDLLGA